jgi:branched-chain amino acid transport system substrate-binding protein
LSTPDEHKNDILIGTIFNRDSIEGDLEEALAAELAVRQVNDEGGLEGRSYAILHCNYYEGASVDSRTATEAIQDATRYLGRLGVPVIVGPATSSMSQDAYPVAEELGVMLISPSATSPALTDMDGLQKSDENPGLFWRTAPPDDLQGLVIAQDMAGRDVIKVAVIYETSTYGSALAETFVGYFQI